MSEKEINIPIQEKRVFDAEGKCEYINDSFYSSAMNALSQSTRYPETSTFFVQRVSHDALTTRTSSAPGSARSVATYD